NHTKKRILKESALIEVFKHIRVSFESMFALEHRTFRHSAPDMQRTFKKLATYMRKMDVHILKPGRKSAYVLPDAAEAGLYKLSTTDIEDSEMEGGEQELEEEVNGDDGDLDV
ncbi:hypothetical protein B0H21DRAFT_702077, partial [Amylocystis lapponica]